MVLIDMRGKQKCDWAARSSTSYWYKLNLTFRCNASVSHASTLRDRSVYLGGELVQFLIASFMIVTLTLIYITYRFGLKKISTGTALDMDFLLHENLCSQLTK